MANNLKKESQHWVVNSKGEIEFTSTKGKDDIYNGSAPPFKLVPLFLLAEWLDEAKAHVTGLDVLVDELLDVLHAAPVPVFAPGQLGIEERVLDAVYRENTLLTALPKERPATTTADLAWYKKARTPVGEKYCGPIVSLYKEQGFGYIQDRKSGELFPLIEGILGKEQMKVLTEGCEYVFQANAFHSVTGKLHPARPEVR